MGTCNLPHKVGIFPLGNARCFPHCLSHPWSQASAEPRPLPEASSHSSAHKSSFSSELPWLLQPVPRNFERNYIAGSVTCCCCMCVYFGSKTRWKPWSQTGTISCPFVVVVFKNLYFFFTTLFLSPFDTKKDYPGIYL